MNARRRGWGILPLVLLACLLGCGKEEGKPLSKNEESSFRAPLGQPMPEAARKAIEAAHAKAGGGPGGPPPGAAAPPGGRNK